MNISSFYSLLPISNDNKTKLNKIKSPTTKPGYGELTKGNVKHTCFQFNAEKLLSFSLFRKLASLEMKMSPCSDMSVVNRFL